MIFEDLKNILYKIFAYLIIVCFLKLHFLLPKAEHRLAISAFFRFFAPVFLAMTTT